jgi:hypothetical protein
VTRGYRDDSDGEGPPRGPYSVQGDGWFVISGPIVPYRGRGRPFHSLDDALVYAKDKYGEDNVRLVPEAKDPEALRWALRVRLTKPKKA